MPLFYLFVYCKQLCSSWGLQITKIPQITAVKIIKEMRKIYINISLNSFHIKVWTQPSIAKRSDNLCIHY